MELAVTVDHGAGGAADGHDIALLGLLGDGLAVGARAVHGLGNDLVLVLDLHRVHAVMVALRREEVAVGEPQRDAVVGFVGLELRHRRTVGADQFGFDHLNLARAVREQRRVPGVRHDMTGLRGGVDGLFHAGGVLEVVGVVAVPAGGNAGVERLELVPGSHHHVPPIAGVGQAQEALVRGGVDHFARRRVQHADAALMGDHDAGRERCHLLPVTAGSR